MELYDEDLEQKKSKTPLVIGICITILVFITILIICGIIYLKSSITTIQIDGVRNVEIEQLFYIESTEDGLELYLPIRQIAPFLGYKGYVGDFKNKSEDKTKCYVECESEVAMFSLNSDVLVKVTEDSEYEYINLDKPVFEKDGELYTTVYGIQKAFNVLISCDERIKNIKIFSMNYLVQTYATKLKIEKYSTEFADKKAIFEDMIIIENDKKYGVISATSGENVLETKYEEIRYLPVTTDFLVKTNGKYGVVSKDANVKIKTVYDDIKPMDNKKGLYLVEQNNVYGVVDISGNVIIEPEYKQIGINMDKYIQNGIESSYILLDEIIPIKNEQELWGFFNIKGEQITSFKYTDVGCEASNVTNSYPAIVIPSYNIIVVKNEKHYNLITSEGEELIPGFILDSVYLKSNAATDQNQFFMTYNNNDKVINIEEWLTSIGR